MKSLKIIFVALLAIAISSCGQTGQASQQDNVTHSNDTMVIKKNQTDSATNTVSRDTTKR